MLEQEQYLQELLNHLQPVLKAGDTAAGGVEILGGTVFLRRPFGNPVQIHLQDDRLVIAAIVA